MLTLLPAAGDTVRAGDLVTVTCEAAGGQPLPSLHLALNGQTLTSQPHQLTGHAVSYVFEAKPAHQGASLTCSAINSAMKVAAEADPLQLEVLCKFFSK